MNRVLRPEGIALFSVNIGQKPYYQLDELKALLSEHFDILEVHPSYGRLYSFWENKVLILEGTPLAWIPRFWLQQKTLVTLFRTLTRILYRQKGITMAAVLVRKK